MSYDVVVADPNWPELGGGSRGADEHYEVQDVNTIIGEMQNADAFKALQHNAILYCWTTSTYLMAAGARVLPALGFRYCSSMVWPKTVDLTADLEAVLKFAKNDVADDGCGDAVDRLREIMLGRGIFTPAAPGLGQRTRQSHELILIGIRGTVPFPATEVRPASAVFAERGRHSEKPEEFWQRVEAAHSVENGRRTLLDMYSRVVVPGRQSWGTVVDDDTVVWIDEAGAVLSSKPLRRQACLF